MVDNQMILITTVLFSVQYRLALHGSDTYIERIVGDGMHAINIKIARSINNIVFLLFFA